MENQTGPASGLWPGRWPRLNSGPFCGHRLRLLSVIRGVNLPYDVSNPIEIISSSSDDVFVFLKSFCTLSTERMIDCFSRKRQVLAVQPRSASTDAEEVLLSKLSWCTVSAKVLNYFDGAFALLNNTASAILIGRAASLSKRILFNAGRVLSRSIRDRPPRRT